VVDGFVVFLPGAGLVGLDSLNIHERVVEVTTSVLYDRAGTGWSDQVELPRSAGEVVVELDEVLRAAGVPGRSCWSDTRSGRSTLVVSRSGFPIKWPVWCCWIPGMRT
jgi:hypothetical protein